jgi:hypothetical protein
MMLQFINEHPSLTIKFTSVVIASLSTLIPSLITLISIQKNSLHDPFFHKLPKLKGRRS